MDRDFACILRDGQLLAWVFAVGQNLIRIYAFLTIMTLT